MTPQQIEDKAIDIATSIQLTDNTLREAAEQKRELVRMIADAIRAACAERDRQAVAFIRVRTKNESHEELAVALAAHLAQNGGGK